MKGLFVIGTDTGVGKTLVSTTLVRGWTAAGRRAAVMKPCETGDGDDTEQLIEATGRRLDRTLVNPYRFALPAAPAIAGAREGVLLDLDAVEAALHTLAREADVVLVEAAGGLMVPWRDAITTADLIVRLGLPALVVARTGLGTINHTLLTVEALRRRQARVLGLVFSQGTAVAGPEEDESVDYAARLAGLPILGRIPWLAEETHVARQHAASAHLDAAAVYALLD